MTKAIKKIALSLVFAAGLASCEETGSFQPRDSSGAPLPVDRATTEHSGSMRYAFNAYVRAHELDATQPLPRNLIVPWVASPSTDTSHGHLIMTGRLTPAGCQEAIAVEIYQYGRYTYRRQNTQAFCAAR